jgi:tetratricopeptide (TPR) repeat protein
MKASRPITVAFSLLLIACLMGSVLLLRRLDQVRTGATLEEVLYISSPQVLKRMSLGYEGLLADVYWTRAVQYFGSKHHDGARRYDLLGPLLEITTTLDPHLIVAYEYGSNFLSPQPPNGAGMPRRAIELDEYGIRNNPNEWRLYYQEGFVYYMELKDYAGAADAFARGARVSNAHPFLRIMAGQMAEHAGDLQMARMMWSTTYQTAQDNSIRANAAAHLRALQVDEDVTNLETAVARYREKTGHLPASFSDLETAGMLRGVPIDPLGHPYKLMPDGRVEVRVPDDLPFIQKGTPPSYIPPLKPKFLPSD